jgi:hydroxyacylglutathione hydrolase
MKIKTFEVPGLAQYSYVVSSGKQAVVIDPVRDIDRYIAYADENDLSIVAVTETHIHADFASGALALAQATGAELAVSGYDDREQYRYSMQHRELHNGDDIRVGTVRLSVLHTPGHTPEHISFLLFDLDRTDSMPAMIFTGDFLFAGSLGRPDLLGDGEKQRLAKELYRSITERIANLPDSVQVYPGHGAGSLCGSGMSERAGSTLGYERAIQPVFHLEQDQFIRTILDSVPPMPAYYPRMKKLNAEGAISIEELPRPKAFSPADFQAISPDVTILDLRRPEAFGGAHIPGAINIGAGQNLSLWAGWLLDPAKSILLVGHSEDLEESRRSLLRVGLDGIVGYLTKGMPAWIDAGLDFEGIPQLPSTAVQQRDSSTLVLDVRSDGEWRAGHIEGAKHIMLGDLPGKVGEIPRDRPLVTVCGSGYRSSIAASLLQALNYENLSSMAGGMSAWTKRGLLAGKHT